MRSTEVVVTLLGLDQSCTTKGERHGEGDGPSGFQQIRVHKVALREFDKPDTALDVNRINMHVNEINI